ncbi:hypothetical protein B0189_07665 [Moraxella cuniculi]|nr:hypothetical protein B0189_07665 [Moraxella cuniculi]
MLRLAIASIAFKLIAFKGAKFVIVHSTWLKFLLVLIPHWHCDILSNPHQTKAVSTFGHILPKIYIAIYIKIATSST